MFNKKNRKHDGHTGHTGLKLNRKALSWIMVFSMILCGISSIGSTVFGAGQTPSAASEQSGGAVAADESKAASDADQDKSSTGNAVQSDSLQKWNVNPITGSGTVRKTTVQVTGSGGNFSGRYQAGDPTAFRGSGRGTAENG